MALLVSCALVRAESQIRREELPSQALGRSLVFNVYVPDGYSGSNLRYPVLYLLHGAGGDESSWAKDGAIHETADRLIATGAMPPAIIVMPGCRTCWWVDGAADKAETSFWSELVPVVSERYRTIEGRRGTVLAGLSAGGYGAVRFALNYPDRISAVAALSPAVYAEAPPAMSAARTQPPFLRTDGSFDLAAWKAKNYPATFDKYCSQSQRVAFYLVSGDDDHYGIAFETMTLFQKLYKHQPESSELRIVDGGHNWDIWSKSIDNAMRYLFRHVDRPTPVVFAGGAGPGKASMLGGPAVAGVGPDVAVIASKLRQGPAGASYP